MSESKQSRSRTMVRAVVLLGVVGLAGAGVSVWKSSSAQGAAVAAQGQMEPMEVVTAAEAVERAHRSAATSIGTVLATRSVTLRNEVAGTVRQADLTAGRVVEAGAVLVALDVSVEAAELRSLEARAALAASTLERLNRLAERRAVSAIEVDNARAERDVALAETERLRAVIERKTIRAPFRARVGIADVHPGQFLESGTLLTTLQGVDGAAHVDFAVAQDVAAGLRAGERVDVFVGDGEGDGIAARIVAVDARVDPATRNATVRARVDPAPAALRPGASVRVRVPVGASRTAVVVPVSALRKGPGGDHVFVLEVDASDAVRAHVRPVEAGAVLGDEVVIVSGLAAGERVAASGSFKLREGVKVAVAEGAAPGGARGGR